MQAASARSDVVKASKKDLPPDSEASKGTPASVRANDSNYHQEQKSIPLATPAFAHQPCADHPGARRPRYKRQMTWNQEPACSQSGMLFARAASPNIQESEQNAADPASNSRDRTTYGQALVPPLALLSESRSPSQSSSPRTPAPESSPHWNHEHYKHQLLMKWLGRAPSE